MSDYANSELAKSFNVIRSQIKTSMVKPEALSMCEFDPPPPLKKFSFINGDSNDVKTAQFFLY